MNLCFLQLVYTNKKANVNAIFLIKLFYLKVLE